MSVFVFCWPRVHTRFWSRVCVICSASAHIYRRLSPQGGNPQTLVCDEYRRDTEPSSRAAFTAASVIPSARGTTPLCAILHRYVAVTEAGQMQSFLRIRSTTVPASSSWSAIAENQRAYMGPQLDNLFIQRIAAPGPWFAFSVVWYSFSCLAYRCHSGCACSGLMDTVRQRCQSFRLDSVAATGISYVSACRRFCQSVRTSWYKSIGMAICFKSR